jgi:hypothetical protein
MKEITLVQKPIIKHELTIVGKEVEQRLAALNIENQVATDETVKALKEMRATLNKEFAAYEQERKVVKKAVNEQYNQLEEVYKVEITGKYTAAVKTLGLKITEFETKIKEDKQAEVEAYFDELCQAKQIDFVTFEQTQITVNLSGSLKSYKDACLIFLDKVEDDLRLIEMEDFQAEILTEYKSNLNASKSIMDVKARKQAEKKEDGRLKFLETEKRETKLFNLGFEFKELSKTYNWKEDDSLLITFDELSNLSKEDFDKKIIEFEFKTKPKPKEVLKAPVQERANKQPVSSFEAPKILTATFEVKGTYEQLKQLNEKIKELGLTYKNI